MSDPLNITEAQLKAALRKHAGIYSKAAQELGCTRQNVFQRVDGSDELKAWCEGIDAEIIDAAEAVVLHDIVANKNVKSAWRMLTMKGRARGYTTRTEVSGPDGGAIPVAGSLHVTVEYVGPATDPGDVI